MRALGEKVQRSLYNFLYTQFSIQGLFRLYLRCRDMSTRLKGQSELTFVRSLQALGLGAHMGGVDIGLGGPTALQLRPNFGQARFKGFVLRTFHIVEECLPCRLQVLQDGCVTS